MNQKQKWWQDVATPEETKQNIRAALLGLLAWPIAYAVLWMLMAML